MGSSMSDWIVVAGGIIGGGGGASGAVSASPRLRFWRVYEIFSPHHYLQD